MFTILHPPRHRSASIDLRYPGLEDPASLRPQNHPSTSGRGAGGEGRREGRLAFLILLIFLLTACADPTAAPTSTPTPRPAHPAATSTPVAAEPTPALTPTWTPVPVEPDSLRQAAGQRGIYIGAAVDTAYMFAEPRYAAVLGGQFSMLTPETEMKFNAIEPRQGRFDFSAGDKLLEFARANHMVVRGHVLAWHQAIPAWFAEGDFSRDESIAILHDFITATVSHYRGQVVSWDVVNEAIYDDGSYRKSLWYQRIGPEYVELAFQWAHEADPDAVLFYNDYGIDDLNPKSNAVYALLEELKAKGIPVGGVGLQMHLRADFPPRPGSVKANMERFADLGLAVHITEMDVSTFFVHINPETRLKEQANVYSQIAGVCLEVHACGALVLWGVADKHTWLRDFFGPDDAPLLYDDYYRPKPAYDALRAALDPSP